MRRAAPATPSTPTAASCSAPLVVDALGWRRVLAAATATSRPTRRSPAGSRCTRTAAATTSRSGSTARYVPAGYGWSFPAGDEVRVGVGSFDPRFHVKEPTVQLAEDLDRDAVRYQGNWIPHKLRDATDDGVFFAGDSAGHCLPLTAEGIRTAFYFGIACGRELRAVVEGRPDARGGAPRATATFSAAHEWKFGGCCGRSGSSRASRRGCWRRRCAAMRAKRFVDWSFGHYLDIAPPAFAGRPAAGGARRRSVCGGCRPRRCAALLAHDQERPDRQQRDPDDAARSARSSSPRTPEPVDDDRQSSSWPAIVAAVTPPAPSSRTVISAVVT